MATHLRVYPRSHQASIAEAPEPTVHVRLGDLLPLIAFAHRNKYRWLQDFIDDEVCITADLYDVLQSFRAYRPA
jgi:hypothetical protein